MFKLPSVDPVGQVEDQGQVLTLHDIQANSPLLDDDGKPVTITVAGTYSKVYRRAVAAADQRATQWFRQHRGRKHLDDATREEIKFDLVASVIIGWSDMCWEDGTPMPCTPDNAVKLLKLYPWIFDQVKEAMEDHEGFSKSRSAS